MVRRTGVEVERCPYISELQRMIGGKWKIEILYYVGLKGVDRFGRLRRCMDGISESTLSKQLGELVDDAFLERVDFHEVPPHVEYRLASRGASFLPILEHMRDWARGELG